MAASVAAYFALQNPKTSSPPQSYSVGDLAGQDVVAPRKLSLADPLETELRRERELSKGPVLFRFDKTISTQVVARFNKEVASMRADFLDSVEKVFNTRTLDTNQVARPIFRQLVIDFRHKHTNFPITVIKAARWVQGDAEEKLQKQLSDKLRVASKKLVHPDGWPDAAQGDHLRVIASDELPGTNANLFQRSQLVIRTNIVAITKVREILQSQLPREQYATARFLAGFIEVNCIFDADLTRQLREQRAESIHAVNTFDEGQRIIRRGERVDAKIKAALDALNVQHPLAALKTNRPRQIWFWSAAIFFAGLAIIILLRSALRPGSTLVSAQNVVVLPRADRLGQTLESRLMPHLVRALMNKLVRGLISQRAQLMIAQTSGTEQLNELEQQLEQISTRLQTRQAAYEKRIAELEKELAAAEEENRELIRARIREARENLEWANAQAGKQ